MNDKTKDVQQLVEVTLGKAHEHAGKQHQAGEKIKVSEPEAKWLTDNGITATPQEASKK